MKFCRLKKNKIIKTFKINQQKISNHNWLIFYLKIKNIFDRIIYYK